MADTSAVTPHTVDSAGRFRGSIESRSSWVVAAITLAILSVSYGAPLVVVVGLKPIAASLGTDRSLVALAASLIWLGTGLGGIMMGWIADRVGMRPIAIFGAGGAGASVVAGGEPDGAGMARPAGTQRPADRGRGGVPDHAARAMIRRARDRCSDPAVIPAEAGTKRSLSPAHRRIHPTVIPAKAGTQRWVPAFAGMTGGSRSVRQMIRLFHLGL